MMSDLDKPTATPADVQKARTWAARNPKMAEDPQRAYAEGLRAGREEASALPNLQKLVTQDGPLDQDLLASVAMRLLPGSTWEARMTQAKTALLLLLEQPMGVIEAQALAHDFAKITKQCQALVEQRLRTPEK